ncbi:MFS transporter [Halorubellus salinus]|uniref:MFS transporter n=1 Tax=Halorubellus salinus TaxID=755309 RepID=UPI001D05C549|nr:MFS transporter [Halorubellus salinus]
MDRRRRTLLVVFVVVFVDLLGFGILIPVIPLYARSFGATEFVGSLLIASYSAMQFLAAPVLGRLSDERGRRPVLLLSLVGSVLAWTTFGLAGALWQLFVARLVAGAMGGNIAAAQAAIADVTPPEDRAKGLGIVGAAFGLGFVFGPALGALASSDAAIAVAGDYLPATVVGQYALPSLLAAGISLANLVLALAVLPETRDPDVSARLEESRLEQFRAALSTPVLSALVVSFFLASFAFSALESQFVFFTNDVFQYGTTLNGILLAYVGVVIAIVQGGLVGPLTNRFGESTLAIVGASIQAVTLFALPTTPWLASALEGVPLPVDAGLIALAVVMTPLSFGNAITNVSLTALVSRSASEDAQGGAFGLTQSAGSLARTFGPAVAGALYTGVAAWAPFVAAAILFVPIAVALARTVGFETTGVDQAA